MYECCFLVRFNIVSKLDLAFVLLTCSSQLGKLLRLAVTRYKLLAFCEALQAAGVLLSEEEAEEASDEEEGGETAPPRPLGARDRRSPTPEDSSDEGRSVKRRFDGRVPVYGH